jgi:4-hydroxy-tetrahydrodipicolinate synthase
MDAMASVDVCTCWLLTVIGVSLLVMIQQARLIPALVTPFHADETLDLAAFERVAHHCIDTGCDGLLVNGTTGEGPTLSLEEKKQLVQAAKRVIAGRNIPLMSGAGSNNTAKSVEEVKAIVAEGVDAILAVVPYYNKPSQAGMIAHFSALAQAAPTTPFVIYNIPGRCGVLMSPETMLTLHTQHPNIIGVKQSHPDMDAVSDIQRLLPPATWTTWCGDDSLTLPMMALGAKGIISVAAHVAAAPMRLMIDAMAEGKLAEAQQHHYPLMPLFRELFFLPNPTVVKTLLHLKGMCQQSFRLPIIPPDAQELARIQAIV